MAAGASPQETSVTKENWYWGPGNRWAWRNMRRLFPTARVGCGSGAASVLPDARQDLGEITYKRPSDGAQATIADMLATTHTDAFIVVKDGQIVFEQYFHGMQPHETHLLMSTTKSIVGTLAGVLAGQGRIDLDATVDGFLPGLADTSFAGATLQQLMDMQVARPLAASYDAIDAAAGWLPNPGAAYGLSDYLLEPGRPSGRHGRRFVYLTENTTLASLILERATGKDFAALLHEEIWSKIGAEADADLLVDARQVPFTSAGLNITLRDLARFALMMLQDGHWNGLQIVPEAWIKDLRQKGDPAAWKAGLDGGDAPPFQQALQATTEYGEGRYRSFWWAADPVIGRYAGFGLGAQSVTIDPAANVVVVKFSSAPDALSGSAALIDQVVAIAALIRAIG